MDYWNDLFATIPFTLHKVLLVHPCRQTPTAVAVHSVVCYCGGTHFPSILSLPQDAPNGRMQLRAWPQPATVEIGGRL
eukprot:4355199-Pleurochrysis_carterae.AAC.1